MNKKLWSLSIALFCLSVLCGACAGGATSESDRSMAGGEGDYWEEPSIAGNDSPPANEGDKYEPVGTNPFVDASHDPFSTFAADVDSASYDIFRRDINNGVLPVSDSIRLEEFVNYFNYDYPAPSEDAEHPFAISISGAPDLFGNGTSLLRVAIQSKQAPEFEKKPANLVFLIDTSGSMTSAEKLPLVKRLLTKALDVLDAEDTVSIVTYAGSVGVRLEPTKLSEKEIISSAINGLSSGGSTSGAAGITLAYKQAEAGFIEGGINHVILCTDGDFNVGISSTDGLVELIEEKRKTGITLTVLGFGSGNLNDAMMERVSNAGNGVYGVITSEEHADDYVENRLLSNLNFIAKDMKIQVEFNPVFVSAYRLLGYENRAVADEDFRDDTVDGGEIGAGHRVTALYEIVSEGNEVPTADGAIKITTGDPVEGERQVSQTDMVLVKVRYKEVDAAEQDEALEVQSSLVAGTIAESLDTVDRDFRWAIAIAAFAEILKESPFANMEALNQIKAIVTEQDWTDKDRAEFVILFGKALPLLDAV